MTLAPYKSHAQLLSLGRGKGERNKSGKRKTYQLLQIPPADLHVAALLVHALGELLRRPCAVVAPRAVVGLRRLRLCRGRGLRRGRAAAKESAQAVADHVADCGTDCDAAVREGESVSYGILFVCLYVCPSLWLAGWLA